MDLSLSFSKYSMSEKCILKYIFTYIIKPDIPKEPINYPLVLGSLTHLFIHLYHDKQWELDKIKNIFDDLNQLYDLITLEYLAKDFKTRRYAVKTMSTKDNVTELIEFIKANEVVFHHAFKFFKSYMNDLLFKFDDSNIVSEFTFNNLFKIDDDVLCMYGSVDLIFWKMYNSILKYLYFTDFKTGKSTDQQALNQLYFYFYNILNYNFESKITDNPDKIDIIRLLNTLINSNSKSIFGIIFMLKDAGIEKIVLNKNDENYIKFINAMFNRISTVILPLHKTDKKLISIDNYAEYYMKDFQFVKKETCTNKKEMSFHCNYCSFQQLCNYRIRG